MRQAEDPMADDLYFIQVTIYAGVPAGVEAFRIARKVLTEEGALK